MLKKSIILLVRKKIAFQTILFFKFFVLFQANFTNENLIKRKLQRKSL